MAASYDFTFVLTSLGKIVPALPTTLLLAFLPLVIGMVLGVPAAVARRFQVPVLAAFLQKAANILKGIPSILLVLLVNYLVLKPIDFLAQYYDWAVPLQQLDKFWIGVIALSFYALVSLTESVLSALNGVDAGQYEAAFSVGLTKRKTLFRIVLPQAVPIALPLLCNNIISLLKATSVVYLISVNDILGAAINSAAINFRYLEAYIAAALVYWALCAAIEGMFALLEKQVRAPSKV